MKKLYSSRAELILGNAMTEMKRRKLEQKNNVGDKGTTEQNIKTTKKRLIFDQVTQCFFLPGLDCRITFSSIGVINGILNSAQV